MHHRGTEATKGSIAVHDTSYAPDERFDVEVDQETEPEIEQLQVCKELSAVNRVERLDSLHFDNQSPLDEQIDSIRRGYADTFVPKRHALLLDPRRSSQRELMTQTRLVARLEESRPKRAMHLYGRADDLPRQHRIRTGSGGVLRVLCACVVNHEPR
jgi:hypothetical protein